MTAKQILIIVVVIIAVGGGSFIGGRFSVKPEIKIVKKTEIKYKTVYRDYKKMTCEDMQKELIEYDTGIPRLDGVMRDNTFCATAGLADRNWSRDFKLKSGMSKRDRDLLIGISVASMIVGALMGGAVDYSITH